MTYVDVDDKSVCKTTIGIPQPEWPKGVDLVYEARRGRRRLYPMTTTYLLLGLALMGWAFRQAPLKAALALPAGFLLWTLVEYLVSRYVLHGIFPDGKGAWQHFLHKRFDGLHWFHHLRPWDGVHINGTLKDTGIFMGLFVALALWTRSPFWIGLIGAFMHSYVFEEWVHHSVHFYRFRTRYFEYIRRHHLYHHSPRGAETAYGLSNSLWDVVFATRIPPADRERLYGRGRTGGPGSGTNAPPQEPAHAS